jgi:FMN phosphatase YigB (HAD superfamily)
MRPAKIKIDWLVPFPVRGSGGHRTIFTHVRDLVARGYECVLHIQERNPHDPTCPAHSDAELARLVETLFFDTGARIVSSWGRLEPCDILFATLWETAYNVSRAPVGRRKAYFVQDFEAWFSPMGDGYLDAENSYRLGLEHVTIGRFLTHLITTEYKGNAGYFDFTVDDAVYSPRLAAKTVAPSVAFLYQPEKPRRCPWLGRETLAIVKQQMPEARIFLYGSDAPTPEITFEVERQGLVTPAQCAELYRKSHVGLCISATNPSRIPFEMMAAGCPVVDVARPNNFHDYEPGAISLAEPTPAAMAACILELLRDPQLRQRQVEAGLRMMRERPHRRAFDQMEELIIRLHETGTVRDPSAFVATPASAAPPRAEEAPRPLYRKVLSRGRQELRNLVHGTRERVEQLRRQASITTASYETISDTVLRLAEDKRVVGFDVFDTLLVRRVEPEVIKHLVARALEEKLAERGLHRPWRDLMDLRRTLELELCQANQQRGLDDEFSYAQMVERWLSEAGVPASELPALISFVEDKEQEVELAAQEAHPAMLPLLVRLKRAGKRLVFISDFYLPVETVHRFLLHAGLGGLFDAGYASSTHMLRKASGRLFRHVLDEQRLAPGEMLFVGDNLQSDVLRPGEHGIDAVHLVDPLEKKRRMQLDLLRSLSDRNPYWRGALAQEILSNSVREAPPRGSDNYELGTRLAPAFILFAESILEKATRERWPALFFCAREGAVFYRMVRRLARASGRPVPAMRYLAVSRKATFLASMRGLSREELARFLRQYSKLSGAQLLDCLCLPEDEFAPLLARAGFPDLTQPIDNLLESEPMARLLADPEMRERFAAHHARARRLLLGYLRQEGFFSHGRALVVDIGWKGSIIDNLVLASRGEPGAPQVEGLLFGSQEDIRSDVCPKRGYFFHGPDKDPVAYAAMTNVALFEGHATANHGSTVGYTERNGRIRPVTRYYPDEQDNWRQCMCEGQRAIRDAFARYLRVRPLLATAHASSVDEWLPYLREQMRKLISYPSAGEVKAFMRTAHVESFGSVSVRRFSEEGPSLADKRDSGRRVPTVDELYRAARFTVWPAGMLQRMNLEVLQPLYDVYDTWHRTHKW